jgi:hypothetical protein
MMASPPFDLLGSFELLPEHAAHQLYAVSRDLYAPILAAFAARCLDDLRVARNGLNLCLARDGISSFLAQRVLLRVTPARFRGVSSRQVRLAYLSRHLVREGCACVATRRLVEGYLRGQGLTGARAVTFVDVGIHGRIQDAVQRWYPTGDIHGRYLIYHRRADDLNARRKHGFLVGDAASVDGTAFLRREAIHLLEDLWSGVYESVTKLRKVAGKRKGTRIRPALERLGTRSQLPVCASDLRRLKSMALRGLVDGVARTALASEPIFHDTTSGRDWVDDQARRLARWIASTREPESPDSWLWRLVIRPDHDSSER